MNVENNNIASKFDKNISEKNKKYFASLMDNYDVLHVKEYYKNKQPIFEKQNEYANIKDLEMKHLTKELTPKEQLYKDVIESALVSHNELRALHGAPRLELNKELIKNAQDYSETLATIDDIVNSDLKCGDKFIGENLAESEGYTITGDHATKMFYDEIKHYDFSKPGYNDQANHFTQMLWKDSKEVGFGRSVSKSGKSYFVANYYPAGNLDRQDLFQMNVLPKITYYNKK